jgi:hypothetical protein
LITWELLAVVRPRGGNVAKLARLRVYSHELAEADDVVGEAPAAALLQCPGLELVRVMICRAIDRNELRPHQ